jgi:hypothetical protein
MGRGFLSVARKLVPLASSLDLAREQDVWPIGVKHPKMIPSCQSVPMAVAATATQKSKAFPADFRDHFWKAENNQGLPVPTPMSRPGGMTSA